MTASWFREEMENEVENKSKQDYLKLLRVMIRTCKEFQQKTSKGEFDDLFLLREDYEKEINFQLEKLC